MYAKHIYEYQQLYRSIEKIFLKNYASTEAAKKYSENISNLKKLTGELDRGQNNAPGKLPARDV